MWRRAHARHGAPERATRPTSPVVLIYDGSACDDPILEGFRRTVLAIARQTRTLLAKR